MGTTGQWHALYNFEVVLFSERQRWIHICSAVFFLNCKFGNLMNFREMFQTSTNYYKLKKKQKTILSNIFV